MLYQHQKEIKSDNPLITGLWLGCGTGKTRICLNLSEGKTLAIAPKTQRDDKNWERELETIKLPLDLKVVSKEDFKNPKKFTPEPYDTLIVDEAHKMLGVYPMTMRRNGNTMPKASQMFYSLLRYVRKYQPKRIYLATATISKSPMTVWGAGVILGKWNLDSFYAFREKYYMKIRVNNREIYIPREDKHTQDELVKTIKRLGYTGRIEDYMDLPPQIYKLDHIELTSKQKKFIKEVELDYPEPLVKAMKKHQIENGILNGNEFQESVEIKDNKIERLVDYSYEFDKMIIFSRYTLQIEKIKKALEKEGKSVYTLTGKTKNRGELLNELKQKDNYVLIAQSQVCEGWELPKVGVIIFASNSYSFADRQQAEGRINRASNLKTNLYIDLCVRDGIDEAVYKTLKNKKDFDIKIYSKENAI